MSKIIRFKLHQIEELDIVDKALAENHISTLGSGVLLSEWIRDIEVEDKDYPKAMKVVEEAIQKWRKKW